MTKYIIAALLIFGYAQVNAQNIGSQTVNSSGRHSTAGGVQIEYAVGGFTPASLEAGTILLTQDFLQPFAGITAVIPGVGNPQLNSGAGIDNAGTTFIHQTAVLEFTLGEFASVTLTSGNNMLTQGILQPYLQQSVLPVTGLEFTARRASTNQVILDWSTVQEINNSGFYVERKKDNETDFATLTFISSKAADGNSSTPLSYTYTDINEYEGKTFYRLKQLDIDQRHNYSPTRMVTGRESGTVTIKAWPVPAVDRLNVKVTGIKETEQLQVIDMQGRMLKKHVISNDQTITIYGLPSGTYILRLSKDVLAIEKIVVQ